VERTPGLASYVYSVRVHGCILPKRGSREKVFEREGKSVKRTLEVAWEGVRVGRPG